METAMEVFNQHRIWILPLLAAGVGWFLGRELLEMLAEAMTLVRRPAAARRPATAASTAGGAGGRFAARTPEGMFPPPGACPEPATLWVAAGEEGPWIR